MGDLLSDKDRKSLEDTMTKYLLVDSIRTDFGNLNDSLKHLDEVNTLLKNRESSVKIRVHGMTDEQLLHELVHARTGASSDTSQK